MSCRGPDDYAATPTASQGNTGGFSLRNFLFSSTSASEDDGGSKRPLLRIPSRPQTQLTSSDPRQTVEQSRMVRSKPTFHYDGQRGQREPTDSFSYDNEWYSSTDMSLDEPDPVGPIHPNHATHALQSNDPSRKCEGLFTFSGIGPIDAEAIPRRDMAANAASHLKLVTPSNVASLRSGATVAPRTLPSCPLSNLNALDALTNAGLNANTAQPSSPLKEAAHQSIHPSTHTAPHATPSPVLSINAPIGNLSLAATPPTATHVMTPLTSVSTLQRVDNSRVSDLIAQLAMCKEDLHKSKDELQHEQQRAKHMEEVVHQTRSDMQAAIESQAAKLTELQLQYATLEKDSALRENQSQTKLKECEANLEAAQRREADADLQLQTHVHTVGAMQHSVDQLQSSLQDSTVQLQESKRQLEEQQQELAMVKKEREAKQAGDKLLGPKSKELAEHDGAAPIDSKMAFGFDASQLGEMHAQALVCAGASFGWRGAFMDVEGVAVATGHGLIGALPTELDSLCERVDSMAQTRGVGMQFMKAVTKDIASVISREASERNMNQLISIGA